jgi:nitroreductase
MTPSDLTTPFDLTQVDRLLSTTPTVRKRLDLDRPVDPETISDCLRLATYAPNAANLQRWRWMVITDAEKRLQIAELYRALFYRDVKRAATSPDPHVQRMYSSSKHLADNLHRVPVHVIPCHLGRPNCEGGNVELSTLYGSIVQAVWSFQLALRSRGLGSAWTTMHLKDEQGVAAILGIPDDVTQIALIPVAYAIGDDFKPPQRQPLEEVAYWNSWEATTDLRGGVADPGSREDNPQRSEGNQ